MPTMNAGREKTCASASAGRDACDDSVAEAKDKPDPAFER